MYVVDLGETSEDNGERLVSNPYRFACRTTKFDSMTQQIMMDYAMYFIKHLPSDQGKDKNPVILLVDGSASRRDAASPLYFMQNNVFLFILAPHTSVWSQPKDNGPNLQIHTCVEKNSDKVRNVIHR